jgi:hypothetical protein
LDRYVNPNRTNFTGLFYGTLTWDDMGTPVDNLWENWVEMVIYGKIYAKSLVNGYFWGKIPLVCL